MVYTCEECGCSFTKLNQLLQHSRTENHRKKFNCDVCGKSFNRKDNLDQHKKKHTSASNLHCHQCGQSFSRHFTLNRHIQHTHQVGGGVKRSMENKENIPEKNVKRLRKDDDPRKYFTIQKIKEQRMDKFKTKASTYKISFKDIDVNEEILFTLRRMFNAIFEDLTKGAKSTDLVRLVVQSSSLDYPIIIPFLRVPELTADRFMSEMERVLQSNEDFIIDESLIFEVTLVDMPNGGAHKRCKYVNTDKFLIDKKCILRIKNDDELCCARAIVTGQAKIDHHENWNSIRQGRRIQYQLAVKLHERAGVPLHKCGLEEVKKFQEVLSNYQLYVVSKEHFNAIIYAGPESDRKIYLYSHGQHYDVISSMSAFLSRNYFCTQCNKGYDHKEQHKCNMACYACRKIHDACEDEWLYCEICNRNFRGNECFALHRKATLNGNSTCRSIYRCKDCKVTVNIKLSKKTHTCGDIYCNVCRDYFDVNHQCYMVPKQNDNSLSEPSLNDEELFNNIGNVKSYLFFYFECTLDDLVACETGYNPDIFGKCKNCLKSNCGGYEHKHNMCVVQKVCTSCMNDDTECEHCGQREHVFSGYSALDEFCKWLFSDENYKTTVLCHNFQGYDSYPILQYLYKNAIVPTVVPNGAKIMCLTVPSCKIKMIDSINFLPMALAKLPAMFGLTELAKGYFPHLYNKKDNQSKVLRGLPNANYYNPNSMKPNDREEFMSWYRTNKDNVFDIQKELLLYCRPDVDILRRCCLKFREDFMEVTNIDPFEQSITIASACNLVFRTNFLQQETIALIPYHGYNPKQKQSIKALQWMKYLSFTEGHRLQHARNGGEKSIGPYLVDGFYTTTDGHKVVLEFHGDFWHGNPAKYARKTVNPVNQTTMGDLYDKTLEKKKYIEDLGYTYEGRLKSSDHWGISLKRVI